MEIIDEKSELGIVERRFMLHVNGEVVPGIHWLPEGASAPHPTILIGHGGMQHKRVLNVLGLATKLVSEGGYGVVALDAPGHGDRMTDEDRRAQVERLALRDGMRFAPMTAQRIRFLTGLAAQVGGEWKALLDDLARYPQWANGPFGYWGMSMGTAFGVPLLAGESRVAAAVLGLDALRDVDEGQLELAAGIRIPLLFIFQWDDELMTRERGLALWDAFGSEEKTMHVNPGLHAGVPAFERDAALIFYNRHLRP
jgi:dienelactone hydrolase